MKNKHVENMAISAILIAVIALMSFVPYVGYIAIPGTTFSICTIHIIVLLAAMLFGWKQGLVAGTFFGVFSLIRAAVMPGTVTDLLFINPLLSVLPRMIFGFLAGLTFDSLRGIESKSARTIWYFVASFILTLTHSVLVLTDFWIFNKNDFGEGFAFVITAIITLNTLVESISATIIVPFLGKAVGRAKKKYDPYGERKGTFHLSVEVPVFALIFVIFIVGMILTDNLCCLGGIILTTIIVIIRIILKKEKQIQ